jgi:hypothetical protein
LPQLWIKRLDRDYAPIKLYSSRFSRDGSHQCLLVRPEASTISHTIFAVIVVLAWQTKQTIPICWYRSTKSCCLLWTKTQKASIKTTNNVYLFVFCICWKKWTVIFIISCIINVIRIIIFFGFFSPKRMDIYTQNHDSTSSETMPCTDGAYNGREAVSKIQETLVSIYIPLCGWKSALHCCIKHNILFNKKMFRFRS